MVSPRDILPGYGPEHDEPVIGPDAGTRTGDLSTIESLIVESLEEAGNYQSFDWTMATKAIKAAKAMINALHDRIDALEKPK